MPICAYYIVYTVLYTVPCTKHIWLGCCCCCSWPLVMTLALGRLQLLLTCSINKVRNRRRLVSARLVSMILPTFQACAQLVRKLCALHMQQQHHQDISSSNNKNNKQLLSQHYHHALFGHNLHKLLIPVTTSPASSAPPVCVCVCVLLLFFCCCSSIPQNKYKTLAGKDQSCTYHNWTTWGIAIAIATTTTVATVGAAIPAAAQGGISAGGHYNHRKCIDRNCGWGIRSGWNSIMHSELFPNKQN